MQLTYRGIPYATSNELPTSQSFIGCYRGANMMIDCASKLPAQSFANLTYRGAKYRAIAKSSFTPQEALAL
jgi:hypothetical protein